MELPFTHPYFTCMLSLRCNTKVFSSVWAGVPCKLEMRGLLSQSCMMWVFRCSYNWSVVCRHICTAAWKTKSRSNTLLIKVTWLCLWVSIHLIKVMNNKYIQPCVKRMTEVTVHNDCHAQSSFCTCAASESVMRWATTPFCHFQWVPLMMNDITLTVQCDVPHHITQSV